jgi:hypothetical protein
MKLNKTRSTFILLALFFLLPPSFFLLDLFQQININATIGQFVVFVGLLIITLRSFNTKELTNLQQKIIFLYITVIFVLMFISIVNYDEIYIIKKIYRVFIKNILIGLLFFVLISNKKFNIVKFNDFLINLAFVFSILSLILYFGYIFGMIQLTQIRILNSPIIFYRGLFFGYLNTIIQGVPRNQFFYSEAGQFAQFLLVPLFLSFQKYKTYRNRVILIKLLVILLAFILTFSLANIFGMLIALSFYYFVQSSKRGTKIGFRFVNVILICLLVFSFYSIYKVSNVETGRSVVAKQTDRHIEDRGERIFFAFNVMEENILGNLKYRSKSTTTYLAKNRTALGNLALVGGLPCLVLVMIIIFIFFKSFMNYFKKSKLGYIYIGFLSFFIGNWWYGDWIGSFFIFYIALYSTYFKYENLSKNILTYSPKVCLK